MVRRRKRGDEPSTKAQYSVTLTGPRGTRVVSLLVVVPVQSSRTTPAPVILGCNFSGNHAVTADPVVRVSHAPSFFPELDRVEAPVEPPPPGPLPRMPAVKGWKQLDLAERGAERAAWPLEMIVRHGFAVATVHAAQFEEDRPGAGTTGVRGLFDDDKAASEPNAWGTLGAWAWGLSRMLDVLAEIDRVDASAAIAYGVSRLGKAALWAAAQDERFLGCIAGVSGCGGAALFRNKSGENISAITHFFPQWFAPHFSEFRDREDQLPVDQHQLLALIAPRGVHVASASQDFWADPVSERLATLHASPAFELFGQIGTLPKEVVRPGHDLPVPVPRMIEPPAAGVRIGGRLSYHVRDGGHGVTDEDWPHFLGFARELVETCRADLV